MNEEFLYYLWKNRLFKGPLYTSDNQLIEVINTGERNYDSGPDFLYARLKIGDTEWAGNVEIHVKASDWERHAHSGDDAYSNVILHVVYENDQKILNKNKVEVPVTEVKGCFDHSLYDKYLWLLNSQETIACAKMIGRVDNIEKLFWLERMMTERLEQRAMEIKFRLEKENTGLQEVFYLKLARSFGFRTNSDAFEWLARSLPVNVLLKHGDDLHQLEALLFGNAGLLDGSFKDEYPKDLKKEYAFLKQKYGLKPVNPVVWKFMRMRPNNFPTIRISQFAALICGLGGQFQRVFELDRLTDTKMLLKVSASSYWDDHYRFDVFSKGKRKVIGDGSVNLLFINAVIPYLFVYGILLGKEGYKDKALVWLEQIRAENNKVIRIFKDLGFPVKNAIHSQAIIHLKNNYCDKKRCLECSLGQKVLQR
jgi:hypothetical protein